MSAQLMKLRDSQEIKDEEEIVVGSSNTTHFFRVKNNLTQQILAIEKMYQAASRFNFKSLFYLIYIYFFYTPLAHQVETLKKEREDKNKIIGTLMNQIKVRSLG